MLALRFGLIAAAAMFVGAGMMVIYDLWFAFRSRRKFQIANPVTFEPPIRLRTSFALVLVAWMPLLMALSLAVVTK